MKAIFLQNNVSINQAPGQSETLVQTLMIRHNRKSWLSRVVEMEAFLLALYNALLSNSYPIGCKIDSYILA